MEQEMGLRNRELADKLTEHLAVSYLRDGKYAPNMTAAYILTHMASSTYDFPPAGKALEHHLACRYYQRGIDYFVKLLGYHHASPVGLIDATQEEVDRYRMTRIRNGRNIISKAFRFLEDQGVIKKLHGSSSYLNAGYMLMLGDDAENEACEEWNRNATDFIKPMKPVSFD